MYDLTKIKNDVRKPPRICIYGGHGVGKTSLACQADKPFLINLEDGIPDRLFGKVENVVPKDYSEFVSILEALYTQDHEYKTVIIDTLDKLEVLILKKVCQENGWADASKSPYYSAYKIMTKVWENLIVGFDLLRDKGMTVILLAHAGVLEMRDPILPTYDYLGLRLNKKEAENIPDWCDFVGYALIKTYTTNEGKRTLAQTAGEHVIMTHTNPAYTAKTRYEMPDEIPMEWSALAQYIPALNSEQNTKEE